MKHLTVFLFAITMIGCTSSKYIVVTDIMHVDVETQDASHDEHILLSIAAAYRPQTFGHDIQPFVLTV